MVPFEQFKKFYFLYFLYLGIIFDGINTVLAYKFGAGSFFSVSIFYRIFLILFIIIKFINKIEYVSVYKKLLLFILIVLIGQLSLNLQYSHDRLFEVLNMSSKLLYIYIIFIPINYYCTKYSDYAQKLKTFLYVFIILNSLIIMISAVFKIELFSSYRPQGYYQDLPYDQVRFGYKGIIPAINETMAFYFVAQAFIYREYFDKKNYTNLFILFLVVISGLLTGAKGAVISLIFISAYYLLKYNKKIFFLTVFGIVGIFIIYLDKILEFINQAFATLVYLFYHSSNSIEFLTTGRINKLFASIDFIKRYWSLPNYLFGGSEHFKMSIEMDFFDGYFLLGLGFFILLKAYYDIGFKFRRADEKFIFIVFLILSFWGGHMMTSAIFSTYYIIYLATDDKIHD